MYISNLWPINEWQANDGTIVVSFVAAGALFALFHFLMLPATWERIFKQQALDDNDAILAAGVLRKVVGGIILGGGAVLTLTLLGLSPVQFGIAYIDWLRTLLATVLVSALLVTIVGYSMRNPKMWAHYPEIRTQRFNRKAALLSGFGWICYLIGFEYFFRGFLLFLWHQQFGLWAALAMTTCVYVLVHLPTNATETASTVPMGFVFGLLAVFTGGFVAPLIVHILVAITSDVVAARLNPDVEN